ncbi:hypothetical protein GWI33_020052 [Rhynchophorus ferrugineus]|uniref:Transposable element P transposase-like RNase H domain-containing protein n=1 Tax=Rhynchophorus ferrugineus TaxID=354439 RepID=A0A834HRT9_RHYFE|nr:hypothetical protein GWI33_020052 [Rhynchophorus ferrugineus]
MFALPSRGTCPALLRKISLRAGLNEQMILSFKRAVQKMTDKDKYCVLTFDEMNLAPNLQYNLKYDFIEGLANQGNNRKFRGWKQPICFTYSNGPVKSALLKILLFQSLENGSR